MVLFPPPSGGRKQHRTFCRFAKAFGHKQPNQLILADKYSCPRVYYWKSGETRSVSHCGRQEPRFPLCSVHQL